MIFDTIMLILDISILILIFLIILLSIIIFITERKLNRIEQELLEEGE